MSDINVKFWQFGGPAFFGNNITPEAATRNGRGTVAHWEGASIWSSPATGAHEVHGLILNKYLSLGGADGVLGFPVTDEAVASDNSGRISAFEYGTIYYSPWTGAFEVYGAIGTLYDSLGEHAGSLGYPTSGEKRKYDGGQHQTFQRGEIYWNPSTGAFVVPPGTLNADTVKLGAFAANRAPAPWNNLPRAMVAIRLRELIRDPDSLKQKSLNLCGPAVFIRPWIKRDPLAFLDFAMQLYDTGQSHIGDYKVQPDGDAIRGTDYLAAVNNARAHGKELPPAADWMILGALRDAENAIYDFDGTWDEGLSGLTMPGELEEWFAAHGRFGNIRDESNLYAHKGLGHARTLDPQRDYVATLINANLIGIPDDNVIESGFPNHWLSLEAPVIAGNGRVKFTYWSFGRDYPTTRIVPESLWQDEYYGAVLVS